jgi:hypothetical protein
MLHIPETTPWLAEYDVRGGVSGASGRPRRAVAHGAETASEPDAVAASPSGRTSGLSSETPGQ